MLNNVLAYIFSSTNRIMSVGLYFCVSNLFSSVKVTDLPPVWDKAANLACHL